MSQTQTFLKVISQEELERKLNKINTILDKCKEEFKHVDSSILADIAELLLELAFKEDEIILFKYLDVNKIEQIEQMTNITLSDEDVNLAIVKTDQGYSVLIYDYIDGRVKYYFPELTTPG